MSAQVHLRVEFEQAPAKKLLISNKRRRRLIGHLRYVP